MDHSSEAPYFLELGLFSSFDLLVLFSALSYWWCSIHIQEIEANIWPYTLHNLVVGCTMKHLRHAYSILSQYWIYPEESTLYDHVISHSLQVLNLCSSSCMSLVLICTCTCDCHCRVFDCLRLCDKIYQ